jgi:tetratricopeptide (TPR) repeat protein
MLNISKITKKFSIFAVRKIKINITMRKNFLLLLVISCVIFSGMNAQSNRVNFINALNAKNMAKAETILKAWDLADSNDPDLYIAYCNYYTVMSQDSCRLSITGYDQKYSALALQFITEGIERFPTRFDMRIAKIFMLGELKKYPEYIEEVLNMIRYSYKIQNNWKREEFMILDKADAMFYDAVSDSQGFLFSIGDPSLFKDIIRISEEMLKYYPYHVQSRLNLSTIYVSQKEYDKSLAKLSEAIKIEPTNAVLYYNLAYVYKMKGDKENAIKNYEFTIARCKTEEDKLKEAAQMRMAELQ